MFSGVAVVDQRIFTFGGVKAEAAVHCYDSIQQCWERLSDLPTPRNRLRAAALGDRIYVVGGMSYKPER